MRIGARVGTRVGTRVGARIDARVGARIGREEAQLGVGLSREPGGWLGWLHLPVVVFVWLESGAWGDLPVFVVHGEVVSSA